MGTLHPATRELSVPVTGAASPAPDVMVAAHGK
jgi:hypothetical protein